MTGRLMDGFPPRPETQVTLANWRTSPFNRWAFHHVREILPSADIAHDPAKVRELPLKPGALEGLRNVQRLLKMRNPKIGEIKAEDIIDNRIMRKLEDSGFIERVYSTYGAKL